MYTNFNNEFYLLLTSLATYAYYVFIIILLSLSILIKFNFSLITIQVLNNVNIITFSLTNFPFGCKLMKTNYLNK